MVHLWRQKGGRECRCGSYGRCVVRSHFRPIITQTLSGSRSDEGLHAAAGVSIDFSWSRLMQYAAQRWRALRSCLTQQQRCFSSVPPPVFRNIPPLSRSSFSASVVFCCFFGTRRPRFILALSVRGSLVLSSSPSPRPVPSLSAQTLQ